jgi:hypothetical protein
MWDYSDFDSSNANTRLNTYKLPNGKYDVAIDYTEQIMISYKLPGEGDEENPSTLYFNLN